VAGEEAGHHEAHRACLRAWPIPCRALLDGHHGRRPSRRCFGELVAPEAGVLKSSLLYRPDQIHRPEFTPLGRLGQLELFGPPLSESRSNRKRSVIRARLPAMRLAPLVPRLARHARSGSSPAVPRSALSASCSAPIPGQERQLHLPVQGQPAGWRAGCSLFAAVPRRPEAKRTDRVNRANQDPHDSKGPNPKPRRHVMQIHPPAEALSGIAAPTEPSAMSLSASRRLANVATSNCRLGAGREAASRASTRASISFSTLARNDSTTASWYSGPSSRCASAAARISCDDRLEILMDPRVAIFTSTDTLSAANRLALKLGPTCKQPARSVRCPRPGPRVVRPRRARRPRAIRSPQPPQHRAAMAHQGRCLALGPVRGLAAAARLRARRTRQLTGTDPLRTLQLRELPRSATERRRPSLNRAVQISGS
jgi:hypothetical protein